MKRWKQTIYGECCSKSNSRRLVSFGKRPAFIKSEKALDYLNAFKAQLRPPKEPFTRDVKLTCTIYYATRRPDLDESLIMDALQPLVVKNDRLIKQKHIYHGLDKENPRADILIEEL